jgi:phage baseplate assembly protein W
VADDASLLTDVALELRHAQLRPVYGAKTERRSIAVAQGPRTVVDLATTAGRPNLGQAIAMRLLTPRGELAELGHPEYGSRLHELIGVPNTETRRSLTKLFVLESLAQELRIEWTSSSRSSRSRSRRRSRSVPSPSPSRHELPTPQLP